MADGEEAAAVAGAGVPEGGMPAGETGETVLPRLLLFSSTTKKFLTSPFEWQLQLQRGWRWWWQQPGERWFVQGQAQRDYGTLAGPHSRF